MVLLSAVTAGCVSEPKWTVTPRGAESLSTQNVERCDIDGDGRPDFFCLYDGLPYRLTAIAFDTNPDGQPGEWIELDEIPLSECRHLVLILDGFSYDLLMKAWESGSGLRHLRVCHPPSRLIAPYPTLTDLSLNDALATGPARGYESLYYNRWSNQYEGGPGDYLSGANMAYNAVLDHRANLITDAFGYIAPWKSFRNELAASKKELLASDAKQFIAYYVTTAGVGTKDGADGQRRVLEEIDRLVLDLLYETRGRLKVTIFSDHGHTYTPATRIDLEGELKQRGWRPTDKIENDNDVVMAEFGLVTYAAFGTRKRAKLAADLVTVDGVELASYVDWDRVIVLTPGGGKAAITFDGEGYGYTPIEGDPLGLVDLLAKLPQTAGGTYDPQVLLEGTWDHKYPAPLERLWRAHMDGGLVQYAPDVIVSLAPDRYFGSKKLGPFVTVASTHGDLGQSCTTTFVASSIAALPPVLHSRQLPAAMTDLVGQDWPGQKE